MHLNYNYQKIPSKFSIKNLYCSESCLKKYRFIAFLKLTLLFKIICTVVMYCGRAKLNMRSKATNERYQLFLSSYQHMYVFHSS
jgi:hypothetical protein